MENYKSPQLCACCGSAKVASTWIIRKHRDKFTAWTFLTAPFGVRTTLRTTYAFEMPICRQCREKLRTINKITTGITSATAAFGCGGIIGIGFAVLMAMSARASSGTVGILSVGVPFLLGVIFGVILEVPIGRVIAWMIKYLTVYDFCDFDGQYFRFDNKTFEKEFALLNPGWVRSRSKWL